MQLKCKKTILAEAKLIKRKRPINFLNSHESLFKSALLNTVNTIYVKEIRNVYILQFFVIKNFKILKKYCVPSQLRKYKYWNAYVKLILFPNRNIENGLWIIDKWSKNYFHWITECLPRIVSADNFGNSYPVLLPKYFIDVPYIQESLSIFNRDVELYGIKEKIKVKRCLLPSHLIPCGFDHDQMKLVRLKFRQFDQFDIIEKKRIYISRKSANRRKILNEIELITLLKVFNFQIIEMETLSFFQQRELMASTEILISNHGAGLTNMIFLNDDAKVIELFPAANKLNTCFYHLACALELDYYYMINSTDSMNMQYSNIHADLNTLEILLNKII
jgi:capsular polysaccharide biosynthesis protein